MSNSQTMSAAALSGRPLLDMGQRSRRRETLRVEAAELALGGDIVQTVPFHIRRTCRRRQQELPQPSVHSRGHVLPKERAIRRPKGLEHAALFLKGGFICRELSVPT
jgi:hypothetical protein